MFSMSKSQVQYLTNSPKTKTKEYIDLKCCKVELQDWILGLRGIRPEIFTSGQRSHLPQDL